MAKRMLVAVALSLVATAHLLAQSPSGSNPYVGQPPSGAPAPIQLPPVNSLAPAPTGPSRIPTSALDSMLLPAGGQPAPLPSAGMPPAGPPAAVAPAPVTGPPAYVPSTSPPPQLTQSTDPDAYWLNSTNGSRVWFQGEYLLWFIKGASMPPLITTGSASDPIPGALGQPNTQVLYGGNSINYGGFSGLRLTGGIWLDEAHNWGLNTSGFYLGSQTNSGTYNANSSGSPVLAQPVVIPGSGEQAYSASYPGYITGALEASLSSTFFGWDINLSRKLYGGENNSFTAFAGFRTYYFQETLTVDSNIQELQPGVLSYLGKPINVGDQVIVQDQFVAHTDFYGGQIGAQYSLNVSRFGLDVIGKFAMGVSQEEYNISGSTSVLPRAGQFITTQGGILAQSTNIGHYFENKFAVAPELTLNAHYDLMPWARLGVGYNIIYLSSVARPGQVVNRNIDPGRVPSDQAYGLGTTSNSPGFNFSSTSLWAQGVSFSLQLRY